MSHASGIRYKGGRDSPTENQGGYEVVPCKTAVQVARDWIRNGEVTVWPGVMERPIAVKLIQRLVEVSVIALQEEFAL